MFDGYKGRVQPGQQSMENCQIFSDTGYDGDQAASTSLLLRSLGGDLEPRKWRFDPEKMEEWSVKTCKNYD